MSARDEVLGRVRAALRDVPAAEPAAPDRTWAAAADDDDALGDAGARAALFAERVAEYHATVTRCAMDDDAIAVAVGAALARHGASRVAA
ncbi:MAG: lactate utilization protein, partial [Solirubrobacterales bacterium]|nr:lactate utilization protein [Solirubrobacterales bacterium]